MIQNQRQYKITKAQAAKFEQSLQEFDQRPEAHPGVDPRFIQVMKSSMKGQLKTLRAEIAEYEKLQRTKPAKVKLEQVNELPQALIRARISSGLSQRQLAERLGLKEQQIQRYESTNYQTASLRRIKEVVAALTASA
jgi:ribosome-binding protein aMBF1 (putative translation factor)